MKKAKNIKLASLGWEGEHWVQEGLWKLGKEDRAGVQQGEAGRAQWGQALLQDCRQDGFQQGSCHYKNFSISRFQVKEELGFGHTHSFFSAAAPISRDVLDYFMSLDIKVFFHNIISPTNVFIVVSRSWRSME